MDMGRELESEDAVVASSMTHRQAPFTPTVRHAILSRISADTTQMTVWKHRERALAGMGDFDIAAPLKALPHLGGICRDAVHRLVPKSGSIECNHVHGKRLLFFYSHEYPESLLELDLCYSPSRAWSSWADPSALLILSRKQDGIRGVSSGAEAVVSLVYHGISINGKERVSEYEYGLIRKGISDDWNGTMEAVRYLCPKRSRPHLIRLLQAIGDDKWSEQNSRLAMRGFVLSAFSAPGFMMSRALFRGRMASKHECYMSHVARVQGRRNVLALNEFLSRARNTGHEVA